MVHKSTVSAAGFLCQPFFGTASGCWSLLQNKERLISLQECRSLPEVKNGRKVTPKQLSHLCLKPRGEVQKQIHRTGSNERGLQQQLYLNLTKKTNKVHNKVVKKTSTNPNFSMCSSLTLPAAKIWNQPPSPHLLFVLQTGLQNSDQWKSQTWRTNQGCFPLLGSTKPKNPKAVSALILLDGNCFSHLTSMCLNRTSPAVQLLSEMNVQLSKVISSHTVVTVKLQDKAKAHHSILSSPSMKNPPSLPSAPRGGLSQHQSFWLVCKSLTMTTVKTPSGGSASLCSLKALGTMSAWSPPFKVWNSLGDKICPSF